MTDPDAARTVAGWLRLADSVAGLKPVEGRCLRCGEMGYLGAAGKQSLCAACYLDGAPAPS